MTTMAILPFVKANGRIDWAALHSRHGVRWITWDFLVGMLAFWLGYMLSPPEPPDHLPAFYYMVIVGAVYGTVLSLCSRCSGVPRPEHTWSSYELLATAALGVAIAYIIFAAVAGLVIYRLYGRYIAIGTMAISFAGLLLPRLLVRSLLPLSPLRVGLYGCIPACHEIDVLGKHPFLDVVGWFSPRQAQQGMSPMTDLPLLGNIDDLDAEGQERFGLDVMVICMGDHLSHDEGVALMRLPSSGVEVFTLGAFLERFHRKVSVEGCSANWFASGTAFMPNTSIFSVKRAMDIGLSLVGLALTLPFWPLIALAVKLSSPGPVFFRQKRVGYLGQEFEIMKFRTMRIDAEKNGAQFAVKNDPRATSIGNFLRKSRLDELPQLLNILCGSMSLVGPRPERPEFVRTLGKEIPMYDLRHTVPPGLTGWAQIRYRYGASRDDAQKKLEYDLYYIRHFSLALELEIIVKTLPMMMKGSR
jgi:exopolysaccharide biosynthesis polyprenyl glycosylphosphotransferase